MGLWGKLHYNPEHSNTWNIPVISRYNLFTATVTLLRLDKECSHRLGAASLEAAFDHELHSLSQLRATVHFI